MNDTYVYVLQKIVRGESIDGGESFEPVPIVRHGEASLLGRIAGHPVAFTAKLSARVFTHNGRTDGCLTREVYDVVAVKRSGFAELLGPGAMWHLDGVLRPVEAAQSEVGA